MVRPKRYSPEERQRIALMDGTSAAIARKLGCSDSLVRACRQEYYETSGVRAPTPKPPTRMARPKGPPGVKVLTTAEWIAEILLQRGRDAAAD